MTTKGAAMTEFESIRYIEPSLRAGMKFMQRGIEGSIVMLNLLMLPITQPILS
ncbi:hypothetical protein ACYEXS_12750 [Paenibacillus sp. MAH-36]|uniref:Uncharacterized protein n=1 Tax=Paenibacillus violae TaxID=3077234 RepID=A0ABU3RE16_9BACL|nr:hypothetical protein [Paenibacillus sp. PFR10]MDU0202528.1 hypothetical protein [Paenibacillus sp. PFR10]